MAEDIGLEFWVSRGLNDSEDPITAIVEALKEKYSMTDEIQEVDKTGLWVVYRLGYPNSFLFHIQGDGLYYHITVDSRLRGSTASGRAPSREKIPDMVIETLEEIINQDREALDRFQKKVAVG